MSEIVPEFENKAAINPDAPDFARDKARCEDAMVRSCNNSYSYAACDLRTDRMAAAPGVKAGLDLNKELAKIDAMWGDEIKELESRVQMVSDEKRAKFRAAIQQAKANVAKSKNEKLKACIESDGFVDAGSDIEPRPGYYRVALVHFSKAPAGKEKYLFMRQDRNGAWSYKDGQGDVCNTTKYGMKITNPHLEEWGDNTKFIGYFYAPKDGVRVAGKKVGLVVLPGQGPRPGL